MGFDITISRYDVGKCPHCGKPIKGDMLDHEDSGGYAWKEWLEKNRLLCAVRRQNPG